MSSELDQLRSDVAVACRVLAARKLAPGILGHISVRVERRLLLIRCRGPQERGLAFTSPEDIKLVTADGSEGQAGELAGGYTAPYELPLHARILKRREDVDCVVHAHPRSVVVADLADIPILPIVGAYDIPGAVLVREGVPVFPSSALIRTSNLGDAVADALGNGSAVVMRGHGLTTTGATPAEAVLRGISIARIAAISIDVVSAGGTIRAISKHDQLLLPDLGSALNIETSWRHEVARLA
jgi:ribulose-5-phosphate 4-epimerase/fuculose-1-phosphate aldolase